MNLYKISQDTVRGYDTYSSAVVIAKNETDAKNIHPSGRKGSLMDIYDDWPTKTDEVKAEYLGLYHNPAESAKVIVASFHAG